MATFLVSYDLVGTDSKSENYDKLIERIKEYPDYARVQLSTWFIKANETAKVVRDEFGATSRSVCTRPTTALARARVVRMR